MHCAYRKSHLLPEAAPRITAAKQTSRPRFSRSNREAREIRNCDWRTEGVLSCRAARIDTPSLDKNCGEDSYA